MSAKCSLHWIKRLRTVNSNALAFPLHDDDSVDAVVDHDLLPQLHIDFDRLTLALKDNVDSSFSVVIILKGTDETGYTWFSIIHLSWRSSLTGSPFGISSLSREPSGELNGQ